MSVSVRADHVGERIVALLPEVSLGVVAYALYLGLPAVLSVLTSTLGLTAAESGRLTSVELGGICCGSILVSRLLARVSIRRLALAGAMLALGANLLSAGTQPLAWLYCMRAVAGLGSGVCYGLCMAKLASSRNATFASSLFGFFLVAASSCELFALPWLATRFGVSTVFALFGLAYLLPIALLRRLTDVPQSPALPRAEVRAMEGQPRPGVAWLCLAAIVAFNTSVSGIWAYAQELGAGTGLSRNTSSLILNVANLLSLAAVWCAWLASRYFGQHRPQLLALLVLAVALLSWPDAASVADYASRLLIVLLAAAVCGVLQVSTMGGLDPGGRHAAMIPAAQGIGISLGPLVGSALIRTPGHFAGLTSLCGTLMLASLALYAGVYFALRRWHPDIARH